MGKLTLTGLRTAAGGPADLEIEAGDCVALTGASGSGKSLLLRAVADLDPHEGAAALDGTTCHALPAPEWRRRVALLPPESRWWLPLVGEHLPAESARELTGLGLPDDALGWQVERLSSGERQRLALIRVLTGSPQALLLDEPTSNVDADNVRRVEQRIASYRDEHGAATIWVTHDPEQARRVASRVLRVTDGRLQEAS